MSPLLNVDEASGSIPPHLYSIHLHRGASVPSTCDVEEVGRQWAQQREVMDSRGQQPRKWEPKHGYILSVLASYKEIVRSPKSGGKHGSKLFPPDPLSGFWCCLMTKEGQITTLGKVIKDN